MSKICKIYDVLIIGAGAAGLFLVANLHGKSVALLEKNATPGKKSYLAAAAGATSQTAVSTRQTTSVTQISSKIS